MGRRKILSGVQEAFEDVDKDSKCMACSAIVKGVHLGNMRNHLMVHHPNVLHELEAEHDIPEQPPPKKQKITLEYDPQAVADAWLDLVVVEGKPFTILHSPSLKYLVRPIFKALNLNLITSRNVAAAIHKRAMSIVSQIKKLCANKMISIKLDGATRHTRRVIIINIQMVVKNKLVIKTIGVRELFGKHTGVNIKSFVLSTLQKYGIKLDQVYSTTQDNGSNFILSGKLLKYEAKDDDDKDDVGSDRSDIDDHSSDEGDESSEDENGEEDSEEDGEEDSEWEDADDDNNDDANVEIGADDMITIVLDGVQIIRCAAHTLALAVYDTLKKKRFTKFRKLAKFLRRPLNISEIRKCKLKVPKLNVPTRWNSTYDMLLSLKNLKKFCINKGLKHLNASDWAFCDKFLEVFEPVKIATKLLQKEQLSLGDFFKCWIKLTLKIKELSLTEPLAAKLYDRMLVREAYLFENNRSIEAALYLDPRFNQIFAKMRPNYFNVERAQQHLLQLYMHMRKVETKRQNREIQSDPTPATSTAVSSQDTEPSSTSSNTVAPSSQDRQESSDAALEKFMNELFEDGEGVANDAEEDDFEVLKLIRNYTDKQRLETNVFDYWYNKRFSSPVLYKLATIVHAVPASKVSVERCFSTLKYILNNYRTRMGDDILENLMLIMLNSKFNN